MLARCDGSLASLAVVAWDAEAACCCCCCRPGFGWRWGVPLPDRAADETGGGAMAARGVRDPEDDAAVDAASAGESAMRTVFRGPVAWRRGVESRGARGRSGLGAAVEAAFGCEEGSTWLSACSLDRIRSKAA